MLSNNGVIIVNFNNMSKQFTNDELILIWEVFLAYEIKIYNQSPELRDLLSSTEYMKKIQELRCKVNDLTEDV